VLALWGHKLGYNKKFSVVGVITNLLRSRLGIENFDPLILVIKNWLDDACVARDRVSKPMYMIDLKI
jgi:hypothetical protein